MSFNTKEFKKKFERTGKYFEQERVGYVLTYSDFKEEVLGHSIVMNIPNIDSIIMLANTLVSLVEESYTDEVVSGFKESLDKSINELRSIHRQKEALKKQLKLAKISSFGGNA